MSGETMFDATKIEQSSGKGIDNNAGGSLGDIADARTKDEDGNPIGGEGEENTPPEGQQTPEQIEEARLAAEKANEGKSPEQIEQEKAAAELEATNAGKTPEQIAEEKKAADEKAAADNIENIKKEARAEFLKSFGVTTEEELKEKLNPTKQDTPEEKAAKEEQYTANLLNFATKEKLFNATDFATLQNLKQTPDTDLALNVFSEQYKELNKDRQVEGVANPVTDDEIKEAFNLQYHINSEDPALKSIGEKQIKNVADGKRSDLEAKFTEAKLTYDDYAYREKNSAPFISFINKTVTGSIPAQLEFEGKNDTKIVYNIKDVDVKELEKIFVNDKAFDDYLANGESQSAKDYIAKTVEVYLWNKNKDAILKTVRDTSYDAGQKAAKVGATAPFDSGKTPPPPKSGTGNEHTPAELAKLKESFGSPLGRQ
jgi:hypothetical protein